MCDNIRIDIWSFESFRDIFGLDNDYVILVHLSVIKVFKWNFSGERWCILAFSVECYNPESTVWCVESADHQGSGEMITW